MNREFAQTARETDEDLPEEEGDVIDSLALHRTRRATKSNLHALPGNQNFINCSLAKTALLLPFKWASPTAAESQTFADEICQRKIVDDLNDEVTLWEPSILLPVAVADLDPNFRFNLGWKEDEQATHLRLKSKPFGIPEGGSYFSQTPDSDDVCRRLRLTDSALRILFPRPSLVARESSAASQKTGSDIIQTSALKLNQTHSDTSKLNDAKKTPQPLKHRQGEAVYQPIKMEKVEIVIYPLGSAVLIFHFNWICDERRLVGPTDAPALGSPTIEELQTWLFLSKFRHKVAGVFDGWSLNDHPDAQPVSMRNIEQHSAYKVYGKHVLRALFFNKPSSLSHIGNFLLAKPGSDFDNPAQRLGRFSKRCYHHTLAVVEKKPASQKLKEHLFHLCRAFGQTNRPPPIDLDEHQNHSTDVILHPRMNRYLALSREGTVSLSWTTEKNPELDFEIKKWAKQFFRVYLILATHVQGEKSVLLELSILSANAANFLKRLAHHQQQRRKLNFEQVDKLRAELSNLATLMTRYTLQMSTDECGGLSEYLEFFSSLRKIFDIRKQRLELSEEIDDVLKLVETTYLQQQAKASMLAMEVRQTQNKLERYREKRRDRTVVRFEKAVALLTVLSLPLITICGLLGTNLDDVPRLPPFWQVVGFSVGVSILIALMFLIIPQPNKKREEKDAKKKLAHLFRSTKKGSRRKRVYQDVYGHFSTKRRSASISTTVAAGATSTSAVPSDTEEGDEIILKTE